MRVFRILRAALAFTYIYVTALYLTLPDVRPLATRNPETTAFIELRLREASANGHRPRRAQQWVPYARISSHLKRAVLVAEDGAFWQHEGIDLEQIRESIEVTLERFELSRGASTITQQLAKNLYLSPSRNPARKLRELMIARLLEAALPKRRIFEIYLNVIEWGDGIYGAEAAARTYFGVPASSLSPSQSALLASAIINPRALHVAAPSPRLLARQRMILRRMGGGRAPAPPPQPPPTPDPDRDLPLPPMLPARVSEPQPPATPVTPPRP
jgi:monofunctional biosynthetic peptidoglycan transglycosylase